MKAMNELFEAMTGKTPQQAAVDGEELKRRRAETEAAELERERARLERTVPPSWHELASVTTSQAAAILGVDPRTIQNYVRDGLLERNERGRVTVESIKRL